jgi:hypothetical protein
LIDLIKIEKEISKRIILVVDHLGKEDIMIKIAKYFNTVLCIT